MYAEDILRIYFNNGPAGKRLEVYGYGLSTAKIGYVDFDVLQAVLDKIEPNPEERGILLEEFIRGF